MRVFGVRPLIPMPVRRLRRHGEERPASLFAAGAQPLDPTLAPATDGDLRGPHWWRGLAARPADGDALGVAGHLAREEEAAGLARRNPFLFDRALFETMLAIPPALQFDPVRDRPLLRDGLRDLIPEAVRARHEKSYFSALLIGALGGPDGETIEAALREPGAPLRAYVDPSRLDALLARRGALRPGEALRLWRAATIDLWLRAPTDRDLFRPCRKPARAGS